MIEFQKLKTVGLTANEEVLLEQAGKVVARLADEFAAKNPEHHLRVSMGVSRLWRGDPTKVEWRVGLGTDYRNEGKAAVLREALIEMFTLAPAAVIDNTIRHHQGEIKTLKRLRRGL